MARIPLKKLFDLPTSRVRRLGEIVGPGTLYAGDPLAGDVVTIDIGDGRLDIEAAVTPAGFAVARAKIRGKTAVHHRRIGEVVVDAGTFAFSLRDPAELSDDERENLLGAEPVRLGDPAWIVSFQAGYGDGVYPVFAGYEGEVVVAVWVDFGLASVSESATPRKRGKELTDQEFHTLFEDFESAVTRGTLFPETAQLHNLRRRKVHVQLFPRLLRLLDAPKVSSFAVSLANRWLELPTFQQALLDAGFSAATWRALHFEHELFRRCRLEKPVAEALAADERIDLEVRFALGDAAVMWPIAAARVEHDGTARAFFCREDVTLSAPSPELRARVESVFRERGLVVQLNNLRRYDPPRLP